MVLEHPVVIDYSEEDIFGKRFNWCQNHIGDEGRLWAFSLNWDSTRNHFENETWSFANEEHALLFTLSCL